MGEIQEIMRQFNQGNGEWQQFIKSIKINNIHGWTDQEMFFKFPIVAVVGENGIGKSTFLKAAVCAYENKGAKNFYPSNMFMSTQWDTAAMAGATIEYKIRQGGHEKSLRWRKTNDWGFTPKKGKPQRKVFFLDISRTLPLDATAGYAKIAKISSEEMGDEIELNDESLKNLSYVLGHEYARARFIGTNINSSREVGLLTKDYGEISQFHQGAGEDTMLDTFKLLQTIPNQSLLVIDEVENSLHPQAQRRFVQYLLKLARIKKLQIILSTHSPFILEELPEIARIMLVRLSDRKDIMYEVSSQFALSTIDDKAHPELHAFLEDEEAVSLFWEILKHDSARYDEFCKKISASPVGSCTVVGTLNELGKSRKLPYNSLAIVDGDKRNEFTNCMSLPGNLPPEKQVITDLKKIEWNRLDERFGIGAGTLFKHLDDAILLPDHHDWTTYIGNCVKKSKDAVWSILIEEWHRQCLSEEDAITFIDNVSASLHR
ncbi:ATP-dependent endonuclease [Paenibacillus sp. sgz500958]|uniref:ATP-dependent nuclease n=1 Tax=Paenibacillus sp. sgz500958 TaxID=3242475 RepID=UPI0036D28D4E